jgi:tRNA(Ile)-lysidine synthase
MADIMRLENDFLAIQTKTAIAEMDPGHPSDKYLISISKLATYHEALQNRIIKSLLLSFSPAKRGVAYVHIKSVRDLMFGSNPRASLNLPFGIEAKRESDQILIHYHHSRRPGNKLNHADKKHISFEYCDIPIPVDVKVEELGVTLKLDFIENVAPGELNFTNANIAYIDHDQIYPPLIIRNVRPGDRFQPLGMAGTQKLKSFFIDHKVAKNKRQGILLLADQRSIIWIAGLRLSERVKITDKSRNICRAEIV